MPLSRLALLMLLVGSATWFSRGYWLPAMGLAKHAPQSSPQRKFATPLRIDPKSLDLGEMLEAKRVDRKLTIENMSDRSISVERFETSCTCMGLKPERMTLPPRRKGEIELTMNFSRPPAVMHDAKAWESRLAIRAFGGKTAAGEPLLGQWFIRSRVQAALMAEPGMAHFDDLTRGQAGAPIRISLRPTIRADDIAVTSYPKWLSCSISNRDGRFELVVQPKAMEKAGTFQGEIDIDLLDRDSRAVSHQSMKARARVLEKVVALPAEVALGVVGVGREASQTITIIPRVAGELRVVGMNAPKDCLATVEFRDGRTLVHVRQTIRESGPGRSIVVVKASLADEEINVPIALTWYAGVADLAVR